MFTSYRLVTIYSRWDIVAFVTWVAFFCLFSAVRCACFNAGLNVMYSFQNRVHSRRSSYKGNSSINTVLVTEPNLQLVLEFCLVLVQYGCFVFMHMFLYCKMNNSKFGPWAKITILSWSLRVCVMKSHLICVFVSPKSIISDCCIATFNSSLFMEAKSCVRNCCVQAMLKWQYTSSIPLTRCAARAFFLVPLASYMQCTVLYFSCIMLKQFLNAKK